MCILYLEKSECQRSDEISEASPNTAQVAEEGKKMTDFRSLILAKFNNYINYCEVKIHWKFYPNQQACMAHSKILFTKDVIYIYIYMVIWEISCKLEIWNWKWLQKKGNCYWIFELGIHFEIDGRTPSLLMLDDNWMREW